MPRVESLAESGLVAVHLMDPEEFDPEKFDHIVMQIVDKPLFAEAMKYIVIDEMMFGFSNKRGNHENVFHYNLRPRFGADLKSAGTLKVLFPDRYEKRDATRRIIEGSSDTLDISRLLRIPDSDRYKSGVMKSKLEPHFEVS